ncbi:MAG: response regulator [Archangiaceae bacterium]|nr:response regulator [Archangiaceae bacterium]
MERVLWVGPRPPPRELGELLGQQETLLAHYADAPTALMAVHGQEVAVAIVTGDDPNAPKTIERITSARPDIQVLLATDTGIARQVVLGLWSGASGVLEFRTQTKNEIVLEIQEWVGRHREVLRERDLLMRLHSLNEDFLKTIVAAEKRAIELEEKLEAARRPAEAPEDGPTQLLLVDDEPVVHDILKRILSKHECVSVMDGESAVKAIWEKGFHVVITDKNLPGMGGLEVMQRIKELAPETDVVMITGYSSKEAAMRALELGASAYIEKPFDDIKLVRERIDKVIEHRRRQQKGQKYLNVIKDRNKDFLDRYRVLRADLEAWMATHHTGKG